MRTALLVLTLLGAAFVVAAPAAEAHPTTPNPCHPWQGDCLVHFLLAERCMYGPQGHIIC